MDSLHTNPEIAAMLQKAQNDPEYRRRLVADPLGVARQELGWDIPDDVKVTVVEESEKNYVFVLPPVSSDRLTEDELDAVAGGHCGKWHESD